MTAGGQQDGDWGKGRAVLDRWNSGQATWFEFVPKGTVVRVRVAGLKAPRAACNSSYELRLVDATSTGHSLESVEVSGVQVVAGVLPDAAVRFNDARPGADVNVTVVFNTSSRNQLATTDVVQVTLGEFMDFQAPGQVECSWVSWCGAEASKLIQGAPSVCITPEHLPQLDVTVRDSTLLVRQSANAMTRSAPANTRLTMLVQGLRNRRLHGASGRFGVALLTNSGSVIDRAEAINAVDVQCVRCTAAGATTNPPPQMPGQRRLLATNQTAAPFYDCPSATYRNVTIYLGVEFQECIACALNASSPVGSLSPGNCSCNAGYYPPHAFTGARGESCAACPAGSFKASPGSAACTACAGNASSLSGSVELMQCRCKSGFTGPDGGPCSICPAGSYKLGVGNGQCEICPQNSVSAPASSALLDCKCTAGYAGIDGEVCSACVAGKWKDGVGPANCTDCEAGKSSAFTAASSAACSVCTAGQYSTPGSSQCSDCPPHSNSSAGSGNISDCTCNSGYTGPDGEACSACSAGTFKTVSGSGQCQQCPAGQFATVEASTRSHCSPCEAGTYSGPAASVCSACPSGTLSSVEFGACTRDIVQAEASASYLCKDLTSWVDKDDFGCDDYVRSGNNWCRDGGVGGGWNPGWGTFSAQAVNGIDPAMACCACGPRLFGPMDTVNQDLAALCLVRASDAQNLAAATTSFVNPDGSTHWQYTGDYRVSWRMGLIMPRSISLYAAAQLADADKVINVTGVSSLLLENVALTCGSGKEPASGGNCSSCETGFYKSLADDTMCLQCPLHSGTLSVASRRREDCVCSAGYYLLHRDADALPNCSACPMGTFKPEMGGSAGASDCDECLAGKYSDRSASVACEQCSAGSYSTTTGAQSNTTCLPCSKGTASAVEGALACPPCSAGKFADFLGATICADCRTECPDRRVRVSECAADADLFCPACCLLASWSLDGDTLDTSLNAVDLVNSGLTFEPSSSNEPWPGMYANFDSSGLDYANVGPGFYIPLGNTSKSDGIYTDAQLTIETWLRTTDDLYTLFHFSESTGANDLSLFGGQVNTSQSRCELFAGRNFLSGPASKPCAGVRDNEWHHLAITLEDNEVLFYLDGTFAGAAATTLTHNLKIFGFDGYFVLGQDADGPGGYYDANQAFVGDMAEFRFWNVSKTQEEIRALMHTRLPHVSCSWGSAGVMQGWGAACEPCAAGSYKKFNGTSSCVECPTNSISDAGQIRCRCAPGYYFNDTAPLDQCLSCPTGTYKDSWGSAPCTLCISHSDSDLHSDDVLDCLCDTGYEGDGASVCVPCSVSTYKDWEGLGPCKTCPLGASTVVVASDGTASDTTNNSRLLQCICGPGYTGPFGPPDGVESRFFFDNACTTCDVGKYKEAFGSARCDACPAHATTASSTSAHYSDCVCDMGFAGPADNCQACPAGTHKDFLGSAQCLVCGAGLFSGRGDGSTGATACSTCPANSQSDAGSSLRTDCACSPGYLGPNGGPCPACEAGSWKSVPGPDNCTTCPAYTTSPPASTRLGHCECKAGYTGPDGGSCEECAQGTFKDVVGADLCSVCPLHSHSASGADAATDCLCNAGFR